MSARVIGVVRSASQLEALTYVASDPSDRAEPWNRAHRCELLPLARRAQPELWAAWDALASVTAWNSETLAHVLAILRETVPCADPPRELPVIGPEVQPPPAPRATAAHPRAFRGTKARPPRPRQPEAVDVRPYLLTRRHIDHVLEQLGQPRGTAPLLAWSPGATAGVGLDPRFVMQLLPLFRGCNWSEVATFAALARALELDARPPLRAALVGVYLAAGDPARAAGWWSHVLAHPAAQQYETAQLVSASGIATTPPLAADFAVEVARLPLIQRWSIYRGLAGGATPAYVSSGLRLGAISQAKIEDVAPGPTDITALVETTIERLGAAMDEDSGAEFWRTHLWRLCGHQLSLVDVLGSSAFQSLQPDAAFWLIRIASSPRWQPELAASQWRVLAPELERIVEGATALGAHHQRKFVEDMGDVYWSTLDRGQDIAESLARCIDLCMRVAAPPFETTAVIGSLMTELARVPRIRDAPDASWLALERACRRTNQARLVGRGLQRLATWAPALVAATFPAEPVALLDTAEALAAVSAEHARELIAAHARTPLADPELPAAPIERLCAAVEPVVRAGGPNPIRRALRAHLSGQRNLSEAQLRGHRDRIIASLGVVRLAAIRHSVDRALAARAGIAEIATSTVRHALAMLTNVDVHRRQLRRMITAVLAGDPDWRLHHPRTTAWFARHPRLDAAAWLAGVETRGELAGIGEVRITLEHDPLEALKLGTYVGSCLGRGGSLEYSAAAVVLDANKQVIYARDARGSVVGRQLVAISEAEELVCFAVYGTAKPDQLEPLFRDHDRRFATRLGLSIYGDSASDDGYDIASILSHDWWDDTAITVG